MKSHTLLASALLLSLAFAACDMDKHDTHDMSAMHMQDPHAAMWSKVTHAVAVLYPTQGNTVSGAIWFDQTGDAVRIHGDIKGLTPNSTHGFHIHEFGDASSTDGSAAGGHYNPEGHPHGGPTDAMHHAGDLGNVTADASGSAHVDLTVQGLSIAGEHDPIIGRSIVLHANPDDLKSQPAGNSGPRIAVGPIAIAK